MNKYIHDMNLTSTLCSERMTPLYFLNRARKPPFNGYSNIIGFVPLIFFFFFFFNYLLSQHALIHAAGQWSRARQTSDLT